MLTSWAIRSRTDEFDVEFRQQPLRPQSPHTTPICSAFQIGLALCHWWLFPPGWRQLTNQSLVGRVKNGDAIVLHSQPATFIQKSDRKMVTDEDEIDTAVQKFWNCHIFHEAASLTASTAASSSTESLIIRITRIHVKFVSLHYQHLF